MQIRQELRRDCQRKCFEGLFKERLAFVANQSHECPDAAMFAKGELNMPETQAAAPANAPPKPKPTRKTVRPKKAGKRGAKTATARRGSKTAKILDLLKRSSGASLKELTKATGWQPHSVRGFLSGSLKKKMRLRVDSFQRDDQERAYRIPSK
jgi:hypothetical protein